MKTKVSKGRYIGAVLAALMFVQFSVAAFAAETKYGKSDTWVVYWYLCGSDLESDGGCATTDIEEMMKVKLPKNVKVIIEAGGAEKWNNDFDAEKLNRYVYDSDGLHLIETIPSANMGDGKTLEEFLRWANKNYPADHKVVDFWNHGGGSIAGVAFDELFENDSLTMAEIRAAFEAVTPANKANPAYELIGFDACLMATIDVAQTLNGYTRWLIASQETEPGIGWEYSSFMEALAGSPANGGALGKAMVYGFYAGCVLEQEEKSSTLAVIDMSVIDEVINAYYDLGAEALLYVSQGSLAFRNIMRAALETIQYSGTGMVDIGNFLSYSVEYFPVNGERLRKAVDAAVYFMMNGMYMDESSGLSFYFDYSFSEKQMDMYTERIGENPFVYLYRYAKTGELSAEGLAYLRTYADKLPDAADVTPKKFTLKNIEDYAYIPVTVNDDNRMVLTLEPELLENITDAYLSLMYLDEDGTVFEMGRCNDFDVDLENGVLTENFRGVWGSIGGELVYMTINNETDDWVVYTVPIQLIEYGRARFEMLVSYTYATGKYEILGVRKQSPEGMAGRNLQWPHGEFEIKLGYKTIVTQEILDEMIAEQQAQYNEWLEGAIENGESEEEIAETYQDFLDYIEEGVKPKLGTIQMVYGKPIEINGDTTKFVEKEIAGYFLLTFEMIDVINRSAFSDSVVRRKFSDVKASFPRAKYIERLSMYGIVTGDTNGAFRPSDAITRAEFAVMLAQALELTPAENYNSSLISNWDNVPGWAKPYVGALAKAGVIDGKTYFGVDNGISQKEMTELCQKAYAVKNPGKPAKDFALDGTGNATRAEAAEVVCKLLID